MGKQERSFPSVRYIKLGEHGRHEDDCLSRGTVYFSYDTERPDRFRLCQERRWSELRDSYVAEGKALGTATYIVNQAQRFFEDEGATLWITFHGGRLWWSTLDPTLPAIRRSDGDGVERHVDGSWSDKDKAGDLLTTDRLSGDLLKVAMFRGASCEVHPPAREYLVRRLEGKHPPEVERARTAVWALETSVVELMRLLHWRDFETLVDLIFSTSGWRRLALTGGSEKTLDLDLVLPSTGERAFVQVKARTAQAELDEYVQKLGERGPEVRMFFVYHTLEANTDLGRLRAPHRRVTVLGPAELAPMVVDAGLARWLIQKTS